MTDITASPWIVAEATPDKPAIIMADTGQMLTYGEMISNANRLANYFVSIGLNEGDCISIFLENQVRYLELVWAAKITGLYYVCIGRHLNGSDVGYIIENSESRILITSAAQASTAKEVVNSLTGDVRLLMMDGTSDGFLSYEDEIAAQPDTQITGRRRGASMLYTSGTTGKPKGVRNDLPDISPHVAPPRHMTYVGKYNISSSTVMFNPGPFYHTGPIRLMMHAQREGATAVSLSKFDAEQSLKAIDKYKVTYGFFVPTMFVRMLTLPDDIRLKYDMSSIQYAIHSAAPCSIIIKEKMINWWGKILYEMYGGTESTGTTAISSQDWLEHKGSVGRATPGTEIHIVDENGDECPPNVPGLIYMTTGKHFEYFKDPEKSAASRHPKGWYALGDIGYLDEGGYLFLTDRQANLIISGGVNIYPQEAENALTGHPDIADIAVIGIPNPDFGEEVKALVVPTNKLSKEQESKLERKLIEFCKSKISFFKCPRTIDFVETLPRSEAGKLLKLEIRKRYWADTPGLTG